MGKKTGERPTVSGDATTEMSEEEESQVEKPSAHRPSLGIFTGHREGRGEVRKKREIRALFTRSGASARMPVRGLKEIFHEAKKTRDKLFVPEGVTLLRAEKHAIRR